ncbi:unnamed protein product [Durusdinium trenchii]|uniref:RING-type domain-containing protein n=1 Tax=Durusdinium trenchii TaxID=1381693 RepID=A0ABP0L881_9DINO
MGSSSASMSRRQEAEPTPPQKLQPEADASHGADGQDGQTLTAEILQLAKERTLHSLHSSPKASDGPDFLGELDCMQCESLLFEPTTLEDGLTVCRPCVKKRRLAQALPEPENKEKLGFGSAANVILSDLLGRCPPALAEAAQARQQGNRLFGEGKYAEASEAYSEAMASSPDIVVLCNRSLARLKLEDSTGAVADAQMALAGALRRSGSAMLAKAWLRLGQALKQEGQMALATFALARAGAEDGLQELCSSMCRTELEKVKKWLEDGRCPPIEEGLPEFMETGASKFNFHNDQEWLRNHLECPLCLGLLWEPSSIPCGHTLCRPCLARTLDHAFDTAPSCPMCRADLSGYLAWLNAGTWKANGALVHGGTQIPVNRKISAIIQRHFPEENSERTAQIAQAEAEAVPIFICSMAMPAVACPLHIFEPRYRLMMRRCIDSGQRQFGMCLFPGAQYGTMLHIQSFKQLPDGRSQIKTIGTRRFQVLEWGEKDGYATGRVQWLQDAEATSDEVSAKAKRLRKAVEGLLKKVAAQDQARLEAQLGPMPDIDGSDGPSCPAFVFWCMGLADLPPRICYELCFGETFREDPEKRLTTILEIYEKKMQARSEEHEEKTDPE